MRTKEKQMMNSRVNYTLQHNPPATMTVSEIQRSLVDYMRLLFAEEILDHQFVQLRQLEDEKNPRFVAQLVKLFFKDSENLINEINWALSDSQNLDFKKADSYVHQLKGSSASMGALRLKNACINFRRFCEKKNLEECLRGLQIMRHEFSKVNGMLESVLKMEQQIVEAGGSIP